MPVSFTCPHCGKSTKVADQYVGQSGPCQFCGKEVTISVPTSIQKSRSGSNTLVIVGIVIAAVLAVTLVCGGVLLALLLPAVQSARSAAQRMQGQNNLRMIGLALISYESTYKTLPPAYIADANGKPMHSWRTLILPFMENAHLHAEYDFNQPWDSPENQHVVETVIPYYRSPSATSDELETNYYFITGQGTLFEDDKPIRAQAITDGPSNTIWVVEVKSQGVQWAEPKDIDVATLLKIMQEGKDLHPGGINACFADGSVRFLKFDLDPAAVEALTTRAGGEAVAIPY